MNIIKIVQGRKVEVELIKIKDYPNYSLYNVIKYVDGKAVNMYKETYTDLQLEEIFRNRRIEEVSI